MAWKPSVYHPADKGMPSDWEDLRAFVLDRDGFRCQACWVKHKKQPKRLSVHHIVPRDSGGSNDPDNLCALCHNCHDLVEPNSRRLPSIRAIRRFYKDYMRGLEQETELRQEAGNAFRPNPNQSWQAIVYGSRRARSSR